MTVPSSSLEERLTEDERELLAALNRARNKKLLKDGRMTYYSGMFARLIETIAHLRGERRWTKCPRCEYPMTDEP